MCVRAVLFVHFWMSCIWFQVSLRLPPRAPALVLACTFPQLVCEQSSVPRLRCPWANWSPMSLTIVLRDAYHSQFQGGDVARMTSRRLGFCWHSLDIQSCPHPRLQVQHDSDRAIHLLGRLHGREDVSPRHTFTPTIRWLSCCILGFSVGNASSVSYMNIPSLSAATS